MIIHCEGIGQVLQGPEILARPGCCKRPFAFDKPCTLSPYAFHAYVRTQSTAMTTPSLGKSAGFGVSLSGAQKDMAVLRITDTGSAGADGAGGEGGGGRL